MPEDPPEPRSGKGILRDPDFSRSRATVLVDSGGSSMCEASVGRDQSEGAVFKNMDGVWGRFAPL